MYKSPNATTLKIVTSQVWHHRVAWRHRWRPQSTRRGHFPSDVSPWPWSCP